MHGFVALVAAIPTAIHFDSLRIQPRITNVTIKLEVPSLIEVRQNQFALMMAQMTVIAQQNDVFRFVAAAFALRLDVMVLETAMIVLLRSGRTPTNAASQTIAQVGLKTRPIFEAHF